MTFFGGGVKSFHFEKFFKIKWGMGIKPYHHPHTYLIDAKTAVSGSNKQSISTRCFIHILPPCLKNLGNPFSNLIISPLPHFLLPWASLNNMLTSLSFIFNWSVPCYFPCRLCLVRRQRQQCGDSVLCTSTTTWKMLWDDFMCRRHSLKRVKNWSVEGALGFVLLKHIRLNQR